MIRRLATLLSLALLLGTAPGEVPFVAYSFTAEKAFTDGIEGPACDKAGNLYVVNFEKQQTIGKFTPDGKGEIFVTLPGTSVGNGIVFNPAGEMFVADYVEHKIWKIDMTTKAMSVFAVEPKMNQPNDLAIAPDGTLYASDPNWAKGTGQVWRINLKGVVTLAAPDMGTTNGLDVSPDGKTLYVNESRQHNIWAFSIAANGSLTEKRLLKHYEDFGFDGMRCDSAGNLYLARYGKGTVTVLSPQAVELHEIDVLGKNPSNLCFGGPDGRTVYVTEVTQRRVVSFLSDQPGLPFQRWKDR